MKRRIYRYLHAVSAPDRAGVVWFDLIEIGLAAVGFLFYFLVRGAVIDRTADALANARWIIGVQSTFGLFIEPGVNRWVLEHAPVVTLVNFAYFWLDFPLIIGVGLLLFWRRRGSYTLLRDALLLSGGIALILYWTFPVAPPRFLKEWGFVDTLEQFSNLAYQTQSTKPFVNPFAAVPSLHVGWALILAIVLFHASDHHLVRIGAVSNLALQTVAVVATANHFLFDGLVGAIVCLAGLGAAVLLQRRAYPSIRSWFGRQATGAVPRRVLTEQRPSPGG